MAGLRPFVIPSQVTERELTLDEAVAMALDNAPVILQRFGEYVAAQQRVAQAFSAMLPQLSLLGTMNRTDASSRPFSSTGSSSRSTLTAPPPGRGRLSVAQLLFDFGPHRAATDAAKAASETAREQVGLQRDLIVLA